LHSINVNVFHLSVKLGFGLYRGLLFVIRNFGEGLPKKKRRGRRGRKRRRRSFVGYGVPN
jgi:hypothetical protein